MSLVNFDSVLASFLVLVKFSFFIHKNRQLITGSRPLVEDENLANNSAKHFKYIYHYFLSILGLICSNQMFLKLFVQIISTIVELIIISWKWWLDVSKSHIFQPMVLQNFMCNLSLKEISLHFITCNKWKTKWFIDANIWHC